MGFSRIEVQGLILGRGRDKFLMLGMAARQAEIKRARLGKGSPDAVSAHAA